MRKILLFFFFALTISPCLAQKYSVRDNRTQESPKDYISTNVSKFSQVDTTKSVIISQKFKRSIYDAGTYLKKSAYMDMASWGCTIASGAAFGFSIGKDNHKPYNIVGFAFGAGAIITRILALNYKGRAGDNLQVTSSGIAYKF